MVKKMIKIMGSLLFALALLLPAGISADAADGSLDWDRACSVSITLRSVEGDHAVIKGSAFTIYQAARASEQSGNLTYTLTEDFAGSGAALTDLNAAGLADTLADYAAAKNISGKVQTADSDGTVKFGGSLRRGRRQLL